MLAPYIYIYIYRAIISSSSILILSVLIGLTSTILVGSAYAQDLTTNVVVKPSLKITIPVSTLIENLDPSNNTFGSKDLTVSVATNNTNGYKLYLNADTTNLVNTVDDTKYIGTLSSSATESNFPVNKWGYRISSGNTGDESITSTTNYYPFVSNKLISSSQTATNNISATLDFATKIDYNTPAGAYNIALNFQALPQATSYYMQDLVNTPEDPDLTTRVCNENPTMVMDKRDGHTYAIARLKDGKCWMVQNLRLGENLEYTTGTLNLTSEDSNVGAGGFVLTNKLAHGTGTPSTPVEDDVDPGAGSGADGYDGSVFFCAPNSGNNFVGCYYNWYTATAGSGTISVTGKDVSGGVDVSDSICPKGWILPKGGPGGDFKALYEQYPSVSQMLVGSPTTTYDNVNGHYLPGFLLSGLYGANVSQQYLGRYGRYWSRTAYSKAYAYRLGITTTTVDAIASYIGKYLAQSVRCLLAES